jgi:uncharacterized coiled-coil protein SlyX
MEKRIEELEKKVAQIESAVVAVINSRGSTWKRNAKTGNMRRTVKYPSEY